MFTMYNGDVCKGDVYKGDVCKKLILTQCVQSEMMVAAPFWRKTFSFEPLGGSQQVFQSGGYRRRPTAGPPLPVGVSKSC